MTPSVQDICEACEYGEVVAEYPKDGDGNRYWNNEAQLWLHPGEFVVTCHGNRFVIKGRFA